VGRGFGDEAGALEAVLVVFDGVGGPLGHVLVLLLLNLRQRILQLPLRFGDLAVGRNTASTYA